MSTSNPRPTPSEAAAKAGAQAGASESSEQAVECPWISRLDHALEVAEFGQKATNLARIRRIGLHVPDGFVLPNRTRERFLATHDLHARIAQQLQRVDAAQPASLHDVSRAIANDLEQVELPGGLEDALATCRLLGDGGTWVVRSSAVGEDSGGAAFPGMLDSVLHVQTSAQLHAAIRRCWASYWTERCLFYSATRGIALSGMGVIIQRQVEAAVSGVMFTRVRESRASTVELLVVECCPGLADGLVAGREVPQQFCLQRDTNTWSSRDGEDPPRRPLLESEAFAALVDAAERLEAEFGGPQDVEWSFDGRGQLFILQSRPITAWVAAAAQRAPAASTVSPDDDGETVVYSNANVNENFPEPLTDFLQEFASLGYYHYFRNLALGLGFDPRRVAAMEDALREIVAIQGGRLYYNLSNIHTVLHMAPGGKFLADAFDQFTGASGRTRRKTELTWSGFRLPWYRRIAEPFRIAWRSWRLARRLTTGVARFESTVDQLANQTHPVQLANCSAEQLVHFLRDLRTIRSDRWLDASLADAASMITYRLLKRELEAEFAPDRAAALHHSLLIGLKNVVSAEPAVRLWQLSRSIRRSPELQELFRTHTASEIRTQLREDPRYADFQTAFQEYLELWGFRRSGELLLTRPSFQEQPEPLLDMLRNYAVQDDPARTVEIDQQHARGERAAEEVVAELRGRRWPRLLPLFRKSTRVRRLLEWTRQSIALRERARHRQALLYTRLRAVLLALGERLTDRGFLTRRDDVLFLQFDEVARIVEPSGISSAFSTEQVQSLVATRAQQFAHWNRVQPPETLELPRGATWSELDATSPDDGEAAEAGDRMLRGASACGGHAAGPAAVLHDIAEFDRLSAGDILVAPQTDPGWGPVFLMIRGLVIQRGGMLSHGAILAREYGIPTVVGVKDATRRIRHGQHIEVHGDRGLVELGD